MKLFNFFLLEDVESCSPKKIPTNAGYNCSGDLESFSCSLSCPVGIDFEFQPEPVYTCYYATGVYMPMPIPNCLYRKLKILFLKVTLKIIIIIINNQ